MSRPSSQGLQRKRRGRGRDCLLGSGSARCGSASARTEGAARQYTFDTGY